MCSVFSLNICIYFHPENILFRLFCQSVCVFLSVKITMFLILLVSVCQSVDRVRLGLSICHCGLWSPSICTRYCEFNTEKRLSIPVYFLWLPACLCLSFSSTVIIDTIDSCRSRQHPLRRPTLRRIPLRPRLHARRSKITLNLRKPRSLS